MATILVVDDSEADRQLIARLLQRDSNLEAEFASNGEEALVSIEAREPDLVLTDLRMPRMDGLELVAQIRRRYPLIPVIVMTSRGSEDIAVQSLRRGASSYVPKRALAQDLLRTARGLLELTHARRSRSRVLRTVVDSITTYLLPNQISLISDLVNHIEYQLQEMRFGDDGERIRVSVALTEALSNALYHGNLEMDSELREKDFEAYLEEAGRRAKLSPYRQRRIRLVAHLTPKELTFEVSDEGRGFDPAMLPEPPKTPNLDRVTGRGNMLMRTLMDEVTFSVGGNAVTMIKRATPSTE